MADAIVKVVNNRPVVKVAGSELLTPMVAAAQAARDAVRPLFGEGPPDATAGIAGSFYRDVSNPYAPLEWFKTDAGWQGPQALKGDPGGTTDLIGTRQQAQSMTIGPEFAAVRTTGYTAPGDGGGGLYKRVASEPSHAGKFQSADGQWWELAELIVRPAMFGAFTDPSVTTATLRRAFDYSIRHKSPVELRGHYIIDGSITPIVEINSGEIHIVLNGDVTITVVPNAPHFSNVIYSEGVHVASHSISGSGVLTIDCNNKSGAGVWLRHRAEADGGTVLLNQPVRVRNVRSGSLRDAAAGIAVLGRYERVVMHSPDVLEVTRDGSSGECGGITVSSFVGDVEIYSPVVNRIRSGPASVDADGIKCFGLQNTSDPNRRRGRVRIYDPVFVDCQGRSYKDQCGDTILYRPRVKRDAAVLVAIPQSNEFDFQSGGGLVLDATCEYVKSGSVSPLGASHSVAVFQQRVADAEMHGAIRNTTIISDVVLPRFALQVTGATARASVTEVDGLTLIPANGLSGKMIDRAVLEFHANEVVAKAAETTLRVRNVSGPMTGSVIGYTGYSSGDLTGKLNWSVSNCSTSIAASGNATRAFHNLSGAIISAFKCFELGDNPGFRSWFTGWSIDFRRLRAGSRFSLLLDGATLINGPPGLPASGGVFIECKGIDFVGTTADDTVCEVTLNGATASPSRWFTRNGGVSWSALN